MVQPAVGLHVQYLVAGKVDAGLAKLNRDSVVVVAATAAVEVGQLISEWYIKPRRMRLP